MQKVEVFTSPGCPMCMILKSHLKDAGIEYEECTDIDRMLDMGLLHAPMMQVDGGALMNFTAAMAWVGQAREERARHAGD